MPATTMTRCAEPPVPSASGSSSLQSAVTVSANRRPIVDDVERQLARGRAGECGGDAAASVRMRPSIAPTRAGRSSAVGREVRGGVEEPDAGVDRGVDVVTEPGADVARRVERVADERDAGVARFGGRDCARRSGSPAGIGSRSDDCSSRRSRAGDHGVSSGSPAGTSRTSLVRSVGRNNTIGSTYAVADPQPEVQHRAVVIAADAAG